MHQYCTIKKSLRHYLMLLTFIHFFILDQIASATLIEKGEKNDDVVFTVCGIKATYPECTCEENSHLVCNYPYYLPISENTIFTNIKVLNETFIIKSASFSGPPIAILKKNKILPGKEHLIESLDFGGNRMKQIENGNFEKFTSLKTLRITTNEITAFPDEIWGSNNASNLLKLHLSHNQFTNFSSISFNRFENLVNLKLSYNTYTDIKDFIFPIQLSNLKILNLALSNIKSLNDKAFQHLKNLEELDLQANPLRTVPTSIKFLAKLQKLHLQITDITTIPKYQFKFNSNLKVLNIYYCMLETIEEHAFCGLFNLKELRLSGNKNLSNIPENAFGNNFVNLPSLEHFSISNCNLSILPKNLINWKNIQYLDILDNPFVCNCSMAWLINKFDIINFDKFRNKIHFGSDVECYNPVALRGNTFTQAFIKISETSSSCETSGIKKIPILEHLKKKIISISLGKKKKKAESNLRNLKLISTFFCTQN